MQTQTNGVYYATTKSTSSVLQTILDNTIISKFMCTHGTVCYYMNLEPTFKRKVALTVTWTNVELNTLT